MDRARLVSAQAQEPRRRRRSSSDRGSSASLGRRSAVFAKFFAFFVSFARVLALVRQLAVRARLRPADPRARARPRRRGEAAGTAGHAADLHPVLRRLRHGAPREHSRRGGARSSRSPARSPAASARRRSGRSASAHDTTWLVVLANLGFLLNAFNLLPIGFLDGGTVWRARSSTSRQRLDPVRERRPGRGGRRRTGSTPRSIAFALRAARGGARRRAARDAPQRDALGDAGSRRSSRRTTRSSTCASSSEAIGEEFLAGFEAVEQIDRPAVSCFGSARVAGGVAAVRARARDGAALRRGGLGRRHRRRAGRDGGGEPRLPRGRRALGRLRDRAAARAGDERLHRPRPDLRPLLRAQDDVREGGGGLLRLPRRLRHGRRAVRVADADPDRQGAPLPGRAARRGVLDAAARVGAPQRARRRDGLARGSRAAHR